MIRHRTPLTEMRARRIAFIKPSALGDIVHSFPTIHALRQRFPEAKITWVVNRTYEPLLVGHPSIDETLAFDRQRWKNGLRKNFVGLTDLVGQLRSRRFDLVVDLQGLLRSGLMSAATGAARRVGFENAREGARFFYTDRIAMPYGFDEHAVDRYWRVADAFGVGHLAKQFFVPVQDGARAWAIEQLRDCPRPLYAMSVGSRWRTKRWPPESFATLAQRAQRQFGGTAVFLGTADESALANQVANRLDGACRDLTGKTSLPQMAAVLENVDVMIANDSGPLHLAAALGRPVVAPYTCTKVRRHGPYGAFRGAVESTVWCQGSYLKKCDRLECITELGADRLWFFLHEILQRWVYNYRSA